MSAKFRFVIAMIILGSVLLSAPPDANAQDANCLGLAAADCKILSAADANITQETSFQYEFDTAGKFNLGLQVGSGTLNAKGSGVFYVDAAQIAALNPNDMSGLVNALKISFDVEGTLRNKTAAGLDEQKGKIGLIVVDGIAYYKDSEQNQWVGINVMDSMRNSGGQSFSSTNTDPTAQALMNDPGIAQAIASMPSIKGFIKLKKSGNTPILEGQKQIEFVYTFDLQTLLASKEFRPVFRALLKANGMTLDNYTDAQWVGFARGFWVAFNSTTVKVTRWVGSKDHLYHALMIDLAFRFNPHALGIKDVPSMSADVHFGVRLMKIGQLFTVTPPADVFMVTTPTATAQPTNRPARTPVPSDTPAPTVAKLPTNTATPTDAATATRTNIATASATSTATAAATSFATTAR